MIGVLAAWWLERMREIAPAFLTEAPAIVITPQPDGGLRAERRRGGRSWPVGLGAVARMPARTPTVLAVPPGAVLETRHVVPPAPRADMAEMLRHELPRVTPFCADEVLWDWRSRARQGDRTKCDVTLTLVPKRLIDAPIDALAHLGIQPKLVQLPDGRRLPLQPDLRDASRVKRRAWAWTAAGLAAAAAAMPFAIQTYELEQTEAAIAALRPAVAKVEAIRREGQAAVAGQEMLERDQAQAGDIRRVLAALTQLLPDDTYLTDFSMRQRQIVIGGRSSSASGLIPVIAAAPQFRNAAFDAPVTRLTGSTRDVFSIRMEAAP